MKETLPFTAPTTIPLARISAPVCEDFLDLIAKISPVGPVIG